jgi:release factor glutamine methyltransferase
LRGDWAEGLANASFDLVVSNPPYIASDVLAELEPEVRDYEPRVALEGGADGLDHYRRLAPEILRVLKPGGRFVVEIGHDQRTAVEALFQQAGAVDVRTVRDLGDHDRVVAGGNLELNRYLRDRLHPNGRHQAVASKGGRPPGPTGVTLL